MELSYTDVVLFQPVRTNQIPRQVPPQPWWTTSTFSLIVGGILPFGCVFIQLFFIFGSLWFAIRVF
jgi:transmembrane 9 superfamily protein 2/4